MTGPAVAPPGGSGAPGAPPAGGWGSGGGQATLTIQPEHTPGTGYSSANIPPAPAPAAPAAPPAGAPAAPAAPSPSAQTVPLGPNTILDGPGIPPELRGKSFSEVMGIYGSMRQVVLRVAEGGSPVAGPPAADRGAPAPAAAPAAPAAPGTPGAPTKEDFWRDPIGSIAAALIPKIDERIQAAVEPFRAGAAQDTIAQVRQQIITEFPDFAAYEPAIREMLKGANPEQLANQELWRTAYWVSKGRATAPPAGGNGTQPPAAPAAPAPPATRFPPQPVVGASQPQPNMSGFFTEAPQAPNSMAGAAALTPAQLAVAQAMNMSPDAYVAWKGGVAR